MPAGKIAFAAIVAFCVGVAAPVLADNLALKVAPLPVPRPAAFDAGAQPLRVQRQSTGDEAGDLPGTRDDPASPRRQFRELLRREADATGLPFDIADTVAAIESGYDPAAIGDVGEIGLMQVRPETAAMLGFRGDAALLAKPEVNIHYGVAYLAEAWRLANGDVCRALMKYRAGHGEEQMSALSAFYCGRARAHLAAVGSPFATAISVPMIADAGVQRPPGARRGAPRVRTAAVSRAFWAAQEARVAAISRRIEAKWNKMASR